MTDQLKAILEAPEDIKREIMQLGYQAERVRELANPGGVFNDFVKVKGSTNRCSPQEQIVIRLDTIRAKIQKKQAQYVEAVDTIESLCDCLPDRLGVIIRLHYLGGVPWRRIALEVCVTEDCVFKRRREAISILEEQLTIISKTAI